ncbi:AAA family ATPase [Desulfococcaceae bacterium HSG9]|nr:AAA family ATPase [Desulfococcaceae bacterium HSG9]
MPVHKELPISMQSFSHIISENCLYVDKTEYVHQLAKSRKLYFLARPRRFGKSLLISTFEALFKGKKELFKKLWIDREDTWKWEPFPVILLDFNAMPHRSPDELNTVLNFALEEEAAKCQIELKTPFAATKFRELILKLKEKTGRDVVVLVDEYDKPVIDFLGKGEKALKIAAENREFLKGFYGILKSADAAASLRFVFITGVSKFTKVSIFSELNNLDDLTMQEKYAALLGYTHEELLQFFHGHIRLLANKLNLSCDETVEKLKTWYYGFRFTDNRVMVYNPVSILNLLNTFTFANYWFETGSPAFLISLLKEKNYYLPNLENIEAVRDTFSAYDIENLNIEPVLFQTGYLTIKDVKEVSSRHIAENIYVLSYPNEEVRISFLRHLFAAWSKVDNGKSARMIYLPDHLDNGRYDAFFDIVKSLFASIPYTLITNRDEGYFHSLFYMMMCGSGIDAVNEVLTGKGRIDLLIELTDKVFIIEFKCNQNAGRAISQIKQKGYAEKYRGEGVKVILVGIDFSSEERNIREWKIEELNLQT